MFSSKFDYIHWRMLTVCFKEYFAMPSTSFNQEVGWKCKMRMRLRDLMMGQVMGGIGLCGGRI
jgi:hypothetical protein